MILPPFQSFVSFTASQFDRASSNYVCFMLYTCTWNLFLFDVYLTMLSLVQNDQLRVLRRNVPRGTKEEKHKNLSWKSLFPGHNFNTVPHKNKGKPFSCDIWYTQDLISTNCSVRTLHAEHHFVFTHNSKFFTI